MSFAGTRILSGDFYINRGASLISLPRGVDPTGLEWMHFMMHGIDFAVRNFAPGKADATPTGLSSMVEGDGFLQLKSASAYFTRDHVDNGGAHTRMIGGRDVSTQTGTDRFFFGGAGFAGSPTIHGVNLFTAAPNSVQASALFNNGITSTSRTVTLAVPGGPTTPMRLFCVSAGGPGSTAATDDDLQAEEYSSGLAGAGSQGDGFSRVGTGAKFGCGGAAAVTITGSGHIWCDIGFSRVLTPMEKVIMRNWLTKTGLAHGH